MAPPAKGDSQASLTKSQWRGKSGSAAPLADHDWQEDRAAVRGWPTRRRALWRGIRVAALLLFGVLGGSALLMLLGQREVQFPFVVVAKTAYRPPFPPNAWAYEDLESLRSGGDALDHKTIDVIDMSDADRTAESLLVPSSADRDRLVNQARQTGVIVFYVSMHGLVDDAGRACLATPESTPFDTATWLPVSSLLRQIQSWEFPERIQKVLILDCNRQESNWHIGLFENDFAARLQQAFDEHPVPNLVILNSASPGQVGWAAPDLRGSVFGQFLRLGLAGAADLSQEGGNHDRRVSLSELFHYLERHVDGWAQANRGARQQPLLIPATVPDLHLTCSLDAPLLQRVLSKFASDAAAEPNLSRTELDQLWADLSEFREQRADSLAPLEMSDLRHRLVWLEQASSAGDAYRLAANAADREWRRLAERLHERLSPPVSHALVPAGGAEYGDAWVPGLAAKLHSLGLVARMGRVDSAATDVFATALKHLQVEPSYERLDELLTAPATQPLASSVGIVQFLRLLEESQRLRSDAAPGTLGPALELQSLADSAAVPADPRSLPWIRAAVDAADVVRRRADDALLIGASETGDGAAAQRAYGESGAIDVAVEEAFGLVDLIAAELPDLARWLESADRQRKSTAENAEPVDGTADALLSLIGEFHQLAESLDAPSASEAAAGRLPFLARFQAIRAQYSDLRRRFDEACERLAVGAEYGPVDVREAAVILALPLLASGATESGLVPLDQRRRIESRYFQATRDLHRRAMETLLNPAPAPAAASAAPGKSGPSLRASAAPLLALLEPAAHAGAPAENARAANTGPEAAPGARVRQILKSVPDAVEAARNRHLASADELRAQWAGAARLARCAAPFIHTPWQTDPVSELRRADIQQLLLWQAGRYLADFWGPAHRGEPSFFEAAALDSIEAARAICIPNPAAAKQIGQLKALLDSRRQAARQGLSVKADALLLVDLVERPKAHATVALVAAGRALPEGRAMLRVADSRGELLGSAVAFPVDPAAEAAQPQELDVTLATARRELTDTVGTATAIFRGHEFRDDLVIRTAGGTTVESRPQQSHAARIRLNGNKRQRASVVLVLDCSASMKQEMPFESSGATASRMEVAKAALVRMLNGLARRGDARVGVILYGHRVGWSTKEPNQLLTQATWGGALPEGLKPYEDVETILPLGRFDQIAAGKVAQRLEKVKPWGETPLYLALTQALLEFRDDDPDAQRSIVVITDGVNYQFNPRPEKAKTVQDVLSANAVRRIPLHIVGFGIDANEARQAQGEFGRLANETGGRYVPVSEAAALADTLEEIVRRRTYSVSTLGAKPVKAPLNTAVDISWQGSEPHDYTVAIDSLSEPVEVTGGEAVELFISQDSQSLISAAYDAGAPIFRSLVGGPATDLAGVRLGVHQPVHEGSTVTFDLSLQQVQQRFVRRPREVWIEITPILTDNRPAANLKYVIYDPDFVPQTPVPVLRATARGWPKDARRARIDFWCKWTETEPSLVLPVADLPDPGQPPAPPAALDGIPGLKYQARQKSGSPARVDFIEMYSPEVSGSTMIKVEIAGPILPTRSLHQFDEANRFATHSFLFDDVTDAALRSAAALRITSRRRLLDNAWHLEVPVLIEVPAQSDTLPSGR